MFLNQGRPNRGLFAVMVATLVYIPWSSGARSMINPLPLPLRATKKLTFVIIHSSALTTLKSVGQDRVVQTGDSDPQLFWSLDLIARSRLAPEPPVLRTLKGDSQSDITRILLFNLMLRVLLYLSAGFIHPHQADRLQLCVAVSQEKTPQWHRFARHEVHLRGGWGGWNQEIMYVFVCFFFCLGLIRRNGLYNHPHSNAALIFTALTHVGREVVRPSLAAMASDVLLCEILDLHGAFRALVFWFSSLDLSNNDDGDVCACFSSAEVPYVEAD